MRETTALFKFINYRKTSYKKPFSSNRKRINGLAQLQESIRHSLQCSLQELKTVAQFNPDLQHLCYLMSGKTKHLTSFSPDKQIRQCYADKQIKRINDRLNTIESGTPDQLQAIATEKQKTDKDIQNLKYSLRRLGEPFSSIISDSKNEITEEQINAIRDLAEQDPEIKRVKQKLNTVARYAKAHNQRIALNNKTNLQANSTVLAHEAIFTIPVHNGVELDSQTMLGIISSFYEKYLPDFAIMFAVYHANEKLAEDQTGNHVHIFVDGYNQSSGKYDLPNQIRLLADKYARFYKLPEIGTDKQLSTDKNQRVGEYIQQLFYQHANKHLKGQDLKLAFLPNTDERQKIRTEIRKQADLPKHQRKFSFYNRAKEQTEQLKKEAKKAIDAAKKAKAIAEQAEQKTQQEKQHLALLQQQQQAFADKLKEIELETHFLTYQADQARKDEEEAKKFLDFVFRLSAALNNWWNTLIKRVPELVRIKAAAEVLEVLDTCPSPENKLIKLEVNNILEREFKKACELENRFGSLESTNISNAISRKKFTQK